MKRILSLLLLCDSPALIEQALEHLSDSYTLERKHIKLLDELKEDVLTTKPLVFWSEQEEMPLEEVLQRVVGHPVFVVVDGSDIAISRRALKAAVHDVLDDKRWPLLPELVERLFKEQKERNYVEQLQVILRTLIEKNTDAIVGHNYQTITFANPVLTQLLGYTEPDELLGQPLARIVYLDDVPPALSVTPLEQGGVTFEKVKQVRLIKKGGEVLRVNLQGLVLPEKSQNPVVWQIKSDDNSWELMQQAVSEQSALLIKHADQVPGVIYQFHLFPDDHLEFPFVSDRLGDLCAIPVEVLRQNGNIFFDYLHPDDLEHFNKKGGISKRTLGNLSLDFRLKAKGEGYRWMHASSKPVHLPDDSVLWHGYMEDITDNKQVEADFKDSEEQVKTLFENAPDGIVILNTDAVVVRWNPKAAEIFGWQSEEILGKCLYSVIAPERYHHFYETSLERFQTGESSFLHQSLEMRAVRKNGQEFPIMMSISDMHSKGELYFLCFIGDITKRKQAQRKLESSLKEKEVLLKEIHHRVKNNLQVITSLLSLQGSFIHDPFVSDIFKKSQYRINSMGMVHEMLYQSKNLSKINYQEYLERLTASLKRAMIRAEQDIAVVLDIPEISLNVDTAIPLSLIVNELVTNAFKYAFVGREKGQVTLILEALKDEQGFLLRLMDDGVGFSVELPTDKTPSLGLLLVRKLAKQLEGSLQRIAVEKGTEYRLLFQEITAT